jgi:tRNA modification GTPase
VRLSAIAVPVPTDLYFWSNRRSFTGQPLAELHTLGSPPVLEAILAELFATGVRPAQPGEFTLRAFLAGRIDLTQAEAVLGVIDAGSERELQRALDQLAGGLSGQILRLRADLLDLLADLEAGLDFADEAIEVVSQATLIGRLGLARDSVAELRCRADRRMRNSVCPRVVLAGPPNAGKSTLFNALAGASHALVSAEPGTTRDYLNANVEVAGLFVELIDTAGRAESVDGIDELAQRLGREQSDRARLVVWCQPVDDLQDGNSSFAEIIDTPQLLRVITKGDLNLRANVHKDVVISVRTGNGLERLTAAIAKKLEGQLGDAAGLLGTTAARCYDSLTHALAALDRAVSIARQESDQELLAIEVRETLEELGKIAGAVYTDDILDRIFSKFCIGK